MTTASCQATRSYVYVTNCVQAAGHDIQAMVDDSRDITRRTFLRYVDKASLAELERDLGYGSWLHMASDWHVSYSRSRYRGRPCVYFTQSAIEYVFSKG